MNTSTQTLRDFEEYKELMNHQPINIKLLNQQLVGYENSLKWAERGSEAPSNEELIKLKIKYTVEILCLIEGEEEPQQPSQEVTEEYVARKFISVLTSAERRGKEFNLTLKEVKKLLNRKTCFYTGVKMVNPLKDHEENPIENARTFDRVDNEQGYVIGNVVACSHWSNQLKNTLFEDPKGLAIGKEKEVKKLLEKML